MSALWIGSARTNLETGTFEGCKSWAGKRRCGRNTQGKTPMFLYVYPVLVSSAWAAAGPRCAGWGRGLAASMVQSECVTRQLSDDPDGCGDVVWDGQV